MEFTEQELINEIWKDVEGYEQFYQVSNLGRIKSKKRPIIRKGKCIRVNPEGIKSRTKSGGYYYVYLYDENGYGRNVRLHRLIAKAFIPNPNGYETVNHKDENRLNNRVENLEWVTLKDNIRYGTRNERISKTTKGISKQHHRLPVRCIETGIIYKSSQEAMNKTGIPRYAISKVCAGTPHYKTAGGHHWEFVTNEESEA